MLLVSVSHQRAASAEPDVCSTCFTETLFSCSFLFQSLVGVSWFFLTRPRWVQNPPGLQLPLPQWQPSRAPKAQFSPCRELNSWIHCSSPWKERVYPTKGDQRFYWPQTTWQAAFRQYTITPPRDANCQSLDRPSTVSAFCLSSSYFLPYCLKVPRRKKKEKPVQKQHWWHHFQICLLQATKWKYVDSLKPA